MTQKKKKTLSREEAVALYSDMQKSMAQLLKRTADHEKEKKSGVATSRPSAMSSSSIARSAPIRVRPNQGHLAAVALISVCAIMKIGFAIVEATGYAGVETAQASIASAPAATQQPSMTGYSKEEMTVLTSLDTRRSELESRSAKLDDREKDIERRDREFGLRLTELRELSQKLKIERDGAEKKNSAQLDQLANVYIAMNPQDAAQLLEQLDVTVALSLLQRMPEKRMGQILPLMSRERALSITQLLGGRAGIGK